MNILISFVTAHPIQATLFGKALWDSFVGAFPAPGKDSSPFYRFCFTFLNLAAFNFQRARSTSIEDSPNFQDAVKRYLAQQSPSLQTFAGTSAIPIVTDWQQNQPK